MVHLFGSLAPVKSGVAVGVGPAALTVGPDSQNAIENKTAARMSSVDPQIPRKNCVPFVTVSNFFIKTIPLCKGQVSYQGALSATEISVKPVNIIFGEPGRAAIKEESGQRESNPHGQLGRLELYH
jgi:hypothetical protein